MEWEFPQNGVGNAFGHPGASKYFAKSGSRDFLSEAARTSDDAAHLVLTRRKNTFLMMNRYPYAVGHLMAVPYRKVGELGALGENEIAELFSLVVHGPKSFTKSGESAGIQYRMNLGECAGAGVPIISTSTLSHAGVAILILCQCFRGRA